MEEKCFRNQIHWITFLFSILVIWVHSFNAELYLGATETAVRVRQLEQILGEGLGQISVPGFFMVSSYLFYRGFTWSRLPAKWQSRIRSILIPYLLWNLLYYIGYIAVTRMPSITALIGKQPVPVTLSHLADALFHYAYNPVFWYLYQLILLIALAPVIYPIFKRTIPALAALALMAYALYNGWDFPHLNMDALFYTCAAAFISLHRESWGVFAESRPQRTQAVPALVVMALILAILLLAGRPGGALYARPLLAVLHRIWGVSLTWLLLTLLPLPPAGDWMKHTFFLYAIHFAWVRLLNKADRKSVV